MPRLRTSGNTPHNPVRFANTVGIVIERVRPEAAIGMYHWFLFCEQCKWVTFIGPPPFRIDRLRWYCRAPEHKEPTVIREASFHLTDIGTQLKPIIEQWMSSEESRRCLSCGTIAEAQPRNSHAKL